jgi:hypothetical protein
MLSKIKLSPIRGLLALGVISVSGFASAQWDSGSLVLYRDNPNIVAAMNHWDSSVTQS